MAEATAAAPAPSTAQTAPQAPAASANGQPAPNAQPGQEAPADRRRVALSEFNDADEFVMVVDGKEVPITAAEAKRRLQTQEAANKRFHEAKREREAAAREHAQLRQLAEGLTGALDDPREFWRQMAALGRNPAEMAQALFQLQQEEAQLTPEQRRLRELEYQAQQWQAQEQARQQAQQQAQLQQTAKGYEQRFNLTADRAGIPNEPRIRQVVTAALVEQVSRVLAINDRLPEDKHVIISQAQLEDIARNAYREHMGAYAQHLDPELYRQRITAEDVAWFQAQQAAKAQEKSPTRATPAQPQQPTQGERARDNRGRFVEPTSPRAANVDANGRRVHRGNLEDDFARRRRELFGG